MRQYLLPPSFRGEALLKLSEKEAKYLERVLRFPVGHQFSGIDRSGQVWDLTLLPGSQLACKRAEDGTPQATSDTLPSFRGPFPPIHLYQCLCKGKKDETILRMAAEAGVTKITFVQSRFCTVDLSDKGGKAIQARNLRLEAIIKEAIQQSGSPVPTQLSPDILTTEAVATHATGVKLYFHQSQRDQETLPHLLSTAKADEEISLIIGSEGGLSEEECDLLSHSGFHPVLLKTNILRAETAAIYAIAACQVILTEHITTSGGTV